MLNPWHRGIVVAFDVESTGVDVTRDRIVTACVVTINAETRQIAERTWLLDPGIDIPAGATAIHGISTEHAREHGHPPRQAIGEIVNALRPAWEAGWPVIGHNVGYDLGILDHELARHGLGSITSHGGPGMVVDTLALDRMLRPKWRGKRKLTDCVEAYSVRLDGAHDARYDAVASARIAWRMAEGFPTYVQRDLHELMDLQARAHRSWAEEFGAYLRSVGKVDDINRHWPYTPAIATAVPA